MRKARGFKLRGKLVKICKWVTTRPRRRKTLNFTKRKRNPISKVLNLARCLRRGAKQLMSCSSSAFPKSGYVPLGHDDPVEQKPGRDGGGIPKGHLAVYVGESQDETQRYLVPVIYFNHPLFGELLKEAEKVYGFNHPGRITIPCEVSEFEKVQMRIASGEDYCQRQRQRRRIVKQADDQYWWPRQ